MPKCSAVTRKGVHCERLVPVGHDVCHCHDPRRAEARSRAAQRAGKQNARKHRNTRAEIIEIKDRLKELTQEVLAGNVSRADASVVATLSGVWLRAAETELKWKELEDLLPRLEAIEEKMAADKRENASGAGRVRWGA